MTKYHIFHYNHLLKLLEQCKNKYLLLNVVFLMTHIFKQNQNQLTLMDYFSFIFKYILLLLKKYNFLVLCLYDTFFSYACNLKTKPFK